jgi:hypothetical protein
MSKTIRYGIGGLIVVSAMGAAGFWYIQHKAQIVAGGMLAKAEAYVEQNMDGFSLSYGDYSANGFTRALTVSDVRLTSDEGHSITIDQITVAGDDDVIDVMDAAQISVTGNGQSLATIAGLEIRQAAILKNDVRALASDPMRLVQMLVVDRITLKNTALAQDREASALAS